MNTKLSLFLLVVARVDGVCVSYSEAANTSLCGDADKDCCKANPTIAGTFYVDGSECSCCCSSCGENEVCPTDVGDEAKDCTSLVPNVPEACMNGKACNEQADCGTPSSEECFYECDTVNEGKCALACNSVTIPTCPDGCVPTVTAGSGARRLLRRLLFSSLPSDKCGSGCEPS